MQRELRPLEVDRRERLEVKLKLLVVVDGFGFERGEAVRIDALKPELSA
jgi:hypothetical protein